VHRSARYNRGGRCISRDDAQHPCQLAGLDGLASVRGASWAVLAGSGAISSGMVGYAKANTVLATPETLFEAASLSKVVLAVAVHDIVREGLIDLDRPVAERAAFIDDGVTRSITPRYLLSHSSGLPDWRDEASEPLTSAFAPGIRFRYAALAWLKRPLPAHWASFATSG
jgi:CubicO group peptidase (beta-lactamase class C family)